MNSDKRSKNSEFWAKPLGGDPTCQPEPSSPNNSVSAAAQYCPSSLKHQLPNLCVYRKFSLTSRKVKPNPSADFCAAAAVPPISPSTFCRHTESSERWGLMKVSPYPAKGWDKCKAALTSPDFGDNCTNLSQNADHHCHTKSWTNTDVRTSQFYAG